MPQLSFVGDYKITGSVLILPIVGDGKLNITMGICIYLNTLPYCYTTDTKSQHIR